MPENLIEIGKVVKPHGVRGDLKVRLHNAGSLALARVGQVAVDGGQPIEARVLGPAGGGGLVLRLAGVTGREQAEALRGATIAVSRADLGPLADDEFYLQDLCGCSVLDERGGDLGQVVRVDDFGASGLLVVRGHGRELMIPLVDPWLDTVDLERKTIQVRDVEPWLDLAVEV